MKYMLLLFWTVLSPGMALGDSLFSEVIDRIEASNDPRGIIRDCRSFYNSQRVLLGGDSSKELVIKTIFKAPDMYRATTYLDGIPVHVRLVTGEVIWDIAVTGENGESGHFVVANNLVSEELDYAQMQVSLANPGISLQETFANVVVSTRIVEGIEYYKLTCFSGLGSILPVEIYVNSKTLQKKAFVFRKVSKDGERKVKMQIEEYYDIGGAQVPRRIVIEVAGRSQEVELIEYKLNLAVEDSAFELDTIIKQLKSFTLNKDPG